MDDSRNQPELETLGYKPGDRIKKHPFPKCNCVDCNIPTEQPTSAPPATLGSNSHVIKPETRVNKTEDKHLHRYTGAINEFPGIDESGGVLANPEQLPGRLHTKECECGNCPEQPNQNLMIITEIEGLLSQVNEKLESLRYVTQPGVISTALEEIDLFQKTTLFKLRKAFE